MADVSRLLAEARQNLLDLSNRNRLLNCRLDGQRVVRVSDELPDQVCQRLVIDKKPMRFLPLPEAEEEPLLPELDNEADTVLDQPEEDDNGRADRHTDSWLQTKLTSTRLQTRLLRMHSEAQVAIEEQGINILHLAVGFLKWYEHNSSDAPRYAPLILIPARLSRRSATSKFCLNWSEEEIETNESLVVKLQKEFGVQLPRLPEDTETLVPSEYSEQVRRAIGDARWEVVDDIALGFFAFGKLRLWKDLDPQVWAPGTGPENSDIVRSILLAQPLQTPSPYDGNEFIDNQEAVNDLLLVKDADSSQMLSMLEVMDERSVVIQGPPGTGKSQTITNIIANALAQGKSVLFVAEKMAALEVVKRWLDHVGLGGSCLELHSFKARKTQVIDAVRETLEAGRPNEPDHESESSRLSDLRNSLNAFAFAMNTPLLDGGISPHQAIGTIERCKELNPPLDDIRLPAASGWTRSQLEQNRDITQLVAKHLGVVGDPQHHPWRGVMAEALLPSDGPRIGEITRELSSILTELLGFLEAVGRPLGLRVPFALAHCGSVAVLCGLLLGRPDSDPSGIANPIWESHVQEIGTVVADGARHAALKAGLLGRVITEAVGQDFTETRQIVARMGQTATRFLCRDYWSARGRIIRVCRKGKRPKSHTEAMQLLDDLCEISEVQRRLASNDDLGRKAFGQQWRGLDSDWAALRKVAEWVPQVIGVLRSNTVLRNRDQIEDDVLRGARQNILSHSQSANKKLSRWIELLAYKCEERFGAGAKADTVPLEQWVQVLDSAGLRVEGVYEWIEYRKSRDLCRASGMAELVDWFDAGGVVPDRLVCQFDFSSASSILEAALTDRPALSLFSGETHTHIIEQFRELDRKLIETTRQYLAARLWERMPQPTVGDSDASPMHYLVNTLRKRRRLPPIRRLMERAGSILTQIKPCFMMSPMSIAQFLPPNAVEFDLLIIDEASQMKPEDALGALARCKQCVIVGDSKQLPPSSFFDRLVGDDGTDEGDDIGGIESILDAAASPIGGVRGGRMLGWHYRSRHESLIAFSNKEFYDSALHVFPSPASAGPAIGLVDHYVQNGTYARSGSRKNLIEAEAVARAVMDHASNSGELSLGVVALSKHQQEAIVDKLEELRRSHTEAEWFFDSARPEPFFVKNLENVQGDERDVIFISIGYGKDPQGYFHMNFGPINSEGGWRRLNVLITRARSRCEVFYSIRPDEIRVADLTDAERHSLRGRVALRNYLEYVRTRQLEQPGMPCLAVESPFEEAVAAALRQHAIDVVPQVGVAGFRIDLGVLDPEHPGDYLLGIECDGAAYHSARSARDRDRLRQEVLENLGWRIHRIWSLDWLRDKEKEIRRLLLAIEAAKLQSATGLRGPAAAKGAEPTIIERSDLQKEAKRVHELVSRPYVKYVPSARLYGHPGDDFNWNKTVDVVAEIVLAESPIHADDLCRRVREAFGLQRTSSRIQEAVDSAKRRAEAQGRILTRGDFLWDPAMKEPLVRSRQDSHVDVERIAPEEVLAAARQIADVAPGLTRPVLVEEVARSLGFQRVTDNIERYLRTALQRQNW